MARYSSERKAALLKKLLPPINMSVAELARQENISEVTLYNWRKHAKDGGSPVPGDNKLTDEWPAEAKFAVVLETAALSEIELSEYCVSALESASFFPKISSSHLKSITSSLDFHYDHSRTC